LDRLPNQTDKQRQILIHAMQIIYTNALRLPG
jgi:hypothetical protein